MKSILTCEDVEDHKGNYENETGEEGNGESTMAAIMQRILLPNLHAYVHSMHGNIT